MRELIITSEGIGVTRRFCYAVFRQWRDVRYLAKAQISFELSPQLKRKLALLDNPSRILQEGLYATAT